MAAFRWSASAKDQRENGLCLSRPESVAKLRTVPFLVGLSSEGLREGKDFVLVIRSTGGDMAKVRPLLDELLASKVDLLVIAAKVLKGTKPAKLPAERPTRFELIVNAKTAKSFGLAIPPTLLATADEVVE